VSGILCASLRSHASVLQRLLFVRSTASQGLRTSPAASCCLPALGRALAELRRLLCAPLAFSCRPQRAGSGGLAPGKVPRGSRLPHAAQAGARQ